jgi:hypothetical protein
MRFLRNGYQRSSRSSVSICPLPTDEHDIGAERSLFKEERKGCSVLAPEGCDVQSLNELLFSGECQMFHDFPFDVL